MMPGTGLATGQQKRTHPLVWLLAIVVAIIAIAVIITGIAVFIVYIIYQPKMPYIKVGYAQLNKLGYDQAGILEIGMDLKMVAENDNRKALASFSDLRFILRFHGIAVAELRAGLLEVAKNSSSELDYLFQSLPIPLDMEAMEAMDAALKQGILPFDLNGRARTRWGVGIFISVRFWTHLSCQLRFFSSNGSVINLDCRSTSH